MPPLPLTGEHLFCVYIKDTEEGAYNTTLLLLVTTCFYVVLHFTTFFEKVRGGWRGLEKVGEGREGWRRQRRLEKVEKVGEGWREQEKVWTSTGKYEQVWQNIKKQCQCLCQSFVGLSSQTSNLHNPSLGSSLRAPSTSAQYRYPQRSSNSSFGWKTSQESWSNIDLEDLSYLLIIPFQVQQCQCWCYVVLLLRPHVIVNFYFILDFPDFPGETSNLNNYYFLEASKYNFLSNCSTHAYYILTNSCIF